MTSLLTVTLLWAFSFSLIGQYLKNVDSFLVAAVRLGLASLCLLPLLRIQRIGKRDRWHLLAIGAVQFGVMYVSYLTAFRYLETYLVALFSVFTPLWVTGIAALRQRRGMGKAFLSAGMAVIGAMIVRGVNLPSRDFLLGFLLMQISNLAFGGGQVWFRDWKLAHPQHSEREVFAVPLAGGFLLALLAMGIQAAFGARYAMPAPGEWGVMLYLGVIASGLGFFLWNYGASRVSTGFLAAANNLIIPVAIAVSFLLFGRRPESPWQFALGSALIVLALAVGSKEPASLKNAGNPPVEPKHPCSTPP